MLDWSVPKDFQIVRGFDVTGAQSVSERQKRKGASRFLFTPRFSEVLTASVIARSRFNGFQMETVETVRHVREHLKTPR